MNLDTLIFAFDFNSWYLSAMPLMDLIYPKIETNFVLTKDMSDEMLLNVLEKNFKSKIQKVYQLFQEN